MEIAVLFGVFAVLLVLGVPVAFAIAVASVACVLAIGLDPIVVVQQVASGFTKVSLLAIPLFIFARFLLGRTFARRTGPGRGGRLDLVRRRFRFGPGRCVGHRIDHDPADGEARIFQGLRR